MMWFAASFSKEILDAKVWFSISSAEAYVEVIAVDKAEGVSPRDRLRFTCFSCSCLSDL